MKPILSILCLLLTSCGSMALAAPLPTATMPLNDSKTSQISTETATPTVDYQNTANAALTAQIESGLTAQAAQIVVAQFTADDAAREYQQLSWTATAESIAYLQSAYTATAYATSVPATQTQQARVMAYQGTAMVLTINAPTQIVAMARAETIAKYADTVQQADLLIKVAFAVMLVLLGCAALWFVVTRVPIMPTPIDIPNLTQLEQVAEQQTVLTIRTDNGGYAHTERTVIPCTPEQFGKLVSGVLNDGKSLAFNAWEGANEPFTRDQFTAVRNWLLSNRLAQSVGQGALILSAIGESLFIEWQNSQVLPGGYKFEGVTK